MKNDSYQNPYANSWLTGILFASILVFFQFVEAQIPSNYYKKAIGKSGYELKSALSSIISGQTVMAYGSDYPGGLWYAFRTSDTRADGTVWDIYSNCSFIPWEDGHVSGSGECTCTQQEHTFCQSWFGYDYACPINSDMFHIYPVDGWINGRRNNYPYGEVPDDPDWVTRVFDNGAKLGYNNYVAEDQTSYCGISYEPIDEYKGDIARGFFYIATRYMFEDTNFSEDYEMTFRSQLRPWALEMMMKWHRNDPVSQKEIDRNNIIYNDFQHNRNPFIDYPELADLIFGVDSSNTRFSHSLVLAPTQFAVVADTNEHLSATLQWVNPNRTISGEAITHIDQLIIKRNGLVVKTLTNLTPSDTTSWTDNTLQEAGWARYQIYVVQDGENGLSSSAKAFVGHYCPITATLYDAYYDGWSDDSRIEFKDTLGNTLGFTKLPCGEGWENVYEIKLPATIVQCWWIPGTYDNENAFTLTDANGIELYTTDYTYAENIDDYTSDVETLSGKFLTFDNNTCPIKTFDTIQPPVVDTTQPVIVDTTQTSVNEIDIKKLSWSAYPNPTNALVELNIDAASCAFPLQVTIFDLLGHPVKTIAIQSGKETVSIRELSNGIYLFRIVSKEFLSTPIRVIKQ